MEYQLLVIDVDGVSVKDILTVPLALTGAETEDVAIERFKDALCVARAKYAERWNIPLFSNDRIDGQLTPEQAHEHAVLMLKIQDFHSVIFKREDEMAALRDIPPNG